MAAVNLINPMAITPKTTTKNPIDLRSSDNTFKAELQKAQKNPSTKPVDLLKSANIKNVGTKIAENKTKASNIEAEMSREFFASMLATPDPLSDEVSSSEIDGGFAKQQQLFELWKLGLKNIELQKDDN